MKNFKDYNAKQEMMATIDYLRKTITAPPWNFDWQVHDRSSYDIVENILKLHRQSPDEEITLAMTEVPRDDNGEPFYQSSSYLHITTRARRLMSPYKRILSKNDIGLSLEYPDFIDPEWGTSFSLLSDFSGVFDMQYKKVQDVLTSHYVQAQQNLKFELEDVKDALTAPSTLKCMAAYNKMKEGTVESTLEALALFNVPRAQLLKFRIKNGLPVDPGEIGEEDMIDLL
jgi:hypothetical protein